MASRVQRTPLPIYLHRFVALSDRHDTQIFSFLVPYTLLNPRGPGQISELSTKDFFYDNQYWSVKFERTEKHLGAYLELKNCLAGGVIRVDYSFFAINPIHFTNNQGFIEKQVEFSITNGASFGRPSFCEISDLINRHFLSDNGSLLVELELANCTFCFTEAFPVPRDIRNIVTDNGYLESGYFNYGASDWNLFLYYLPKGGDIAGAERQLGVMNPGKGDISITLVRHNRFEHSSLIRLKVTFTTADNQKFESGIIEQPVDIKGYGPQFAIDFQALRQLNPKHQLNIMVEMLAMLRLSRIDLIPTSRTKNCVRCYDTDKQEWFVESNILGRVLKVYFIYVDIQNVPRGFTRFISWNLQLIPTDKSKPPVKALNGPFSSFFPQKERDEGLEVSFDISVEEICDTNAGYTNPNTGTLTFEIEWLHSHVLLCENYQFYDNIMRLQKHQMSREISTLQAENYSLEKKIHLSQQSLSLKDVAGSILPGKSFLSNHIGSNNTSTSTSQPPTTKSLMPNSPSAIVSSAMSASPFFSKNIFGGSSNSTPTSNPPSGIKTSIEPKKTASNPNVSATPINHPPVSRVEQQPNLMRGGSDLDIGGYRHPSPSNSVHSVKEASSGYSHTPYTRTPRSSAPNNPSRQRFTSPPPPSQPMVNHTGEQYSRTIRYIPSGGGVAPAAPATQEPGTYRSSAANHMRQLADIVPQESRSHATYRSGERSMSEYPSSQHHTTNEANYAAQRSSRVSNTSVEGHRRAPSYSYADEVRPMTGAPRKPTSNW